jgi:apolipoprotein N-acyltransferase
MGFYSTSVDASVGNTPAPVNLGRLSAGSIVCSEITNQTAVQNSIDKADILFSIGTEVMFSNEIPSKFNFLKAKQYAAQYKTPVIKATKFGPSGIFDENGGVIAELDYGEEGILLADIEL